MSGHPLPVGFLAARDHEFGLNIDLAAVDALAVHALFAASTLFECLDDPDNRVCLAFSRLLERGNYGDEGLLDRLHAGETIKVFHHGITQSATFKRAIFVRFPDQNLAEKDAHILLMSLATDKN